MQSIRQSDLNLLVLDIEGTGGTERATNPDLERRMGVLALTAADIVILNINNVLVENAATVTLLHVILQVTPHKAFYSTHTADYKWKTLHIKRMLL